MAKTYRQEHSWRAGDADSTRAAVQDIFERFGDVDVQIGVFYAFDGCAGPLHVRTSEHESLADEKLKPILGDWPAFQAEIVPIW